jgi:APA family basic amino acid/polyamine antiporter
LKKLERSLNLTTVIAISIGGMLGSGIFVLPGIAAAKTGSSIWLAYLLAAICILPAALSQSELSTAMPSTGGAYLYIERAFGPIFGTIAGLGLWLSLLLKSSFALVGFGAYLSVLGNVPNDYTRYMSIFFLLIILLLNVYGVKKVGKVQIVVVSISLITLIILFIFGLPKVDPVLLDPFFSEGGMGLISTVAFVYISYAGVTKVAAIAGEIKNPSKNLPRAIILSLFIMTLIYVFIAFTLVGNIPISTLATDIKPIYSLAESIGGSYVGYLVAVVAVITLISMANSGVLAASRFPFAMAIDKLLPQFMGKIHVKYLTPVPSIVVTGIAMTLVILFLDVEKIAKLASAFMVMMFISVNLCVVILRETSAQWYNPTYKSPLYPYVQIFGIISGIILLILLGFIPMLAILTIVLIGFVIYFYVGKKTARTGILRKYGHRPALFLLYKKHRKEMTESIEPVKIQDTSLDGKIASDAGVVIPLLGNEKSPEMLVEIGAALNRKEITQAVHITEVPNQTFLDAVMEENPTIHSLARRFGGLAKARKAKIDFESVVTHDLHETIRELSEQTHCDWMVMGWNARAHKGILVRNPIGWFVTHVNSDFALFRDNGVRHISKVVMALRPGRRDKNFVAIADRICSFYKASLTLLHIVPEASSTDDIKQITKASEKLLLKTSCDSFVEVRHSNDPIEMITEMSAEFDLLIIGTPEKGNWQNVLLGQNKDKFADHSVCSVLRLTVKS